MTRSRGLGAAHGAVLGAGTVLTLFLMTTPDARFVVYAPAIRPILEVGGGLIVLFAALILAIPAEDDVRPSRNAFATALAVLAVSNAAFGLLPAFVDEAASVGELGYYPWTVARYVVITFFVLAGLERPRLTLGRSLVLGMGALVAMEAVVIALGPRLATPLELVTVGSARVEVLRPALHTALQAPSIVLFGVGAWLAARLYLRGATSDYAWLSLALTVQVIAQVHGLLFPAFLGPVLRSADVLRFVSFGLLSVGAFVQMRRVHRDRSTALRRREQELRREQALSDQLRAFADQEADFRALVTHELATPIATIRAFGSAARRRAGDHGDEELDRVLESITDEADRLQQLARRMEELRRLELEDFECDLRPVLVRRLVEGSTQFVRGLPGSHDVDARMEEERVLADPVRLEQALRNILLNAARYSPVGAPITLMGRRVDARTYEIQVDDEGPGIPVVERQRVLRRFGRGTAGSRSRGEGLGLYVAQRVVEAHGGRLRLADAPTGGTRVTIELLLATRAAADTAGQG